MAPIMHRLQQGSVRTLQHMQQGTSFSLRPSCLLFELNVLSNINLLSTGKTSGRSSLHFFPSFLFTHPILISNQRNLTWRSMKVALQTSPLSTVSAGSRLNSSTLRCRNAVTAWISGAESVCWSLVRRWSCSNRFKYLRCNRGRCCSPHP